MAAEAVPAEPAPIVAALDQAIAGRWSELRLEVSCSSDSGELQEFELFASGVGIWNRSRQFELSDAEIQRLLEVLRDGGFAALAGFYGKGGASSEPPQRQSPSIGCRIVLHLDGTAHGSAQRNVGFQSERLRSLALRVLDLFREVGEAGIGADSLADGLDKVADGRLAPETLRLVVHHKPDREALAGGAEGLLLRIEPGRISTRTLGPEPVLGPVIELADEGAVAEVAALLAAGSPESLPGNLWADHHTSLSVTVLDHRKQIQAQRFSRLEPTTHGDAQARFDRLFAELRALHERILREDVADAGATDAPDHGGPTLDEILTRHHEAIGGLEAWTAVETLRIEGTVSALHQSTARFARAHRRPGAFRQERILLGESTIEILDGPSGWLHVSHGGGRSMKIPASQLAPLLVEADPGGPLLDWREKGYRLRLMGSESCGDTRCHRIEVVLAPEARVEVLVAAASGLIQAYEVAQSSRLGKGQLTIALSDYRAVDGAVLAHRIETRRPGLPTPETKEITRVEINPVLPEDMFSPPALRSKG